MRGHCVALAILVVFFGSDQSAALFLPKSASCNMNKCSQVKNILKADTGSKKCSLVKKWKSCLEGMTHPPCSISSGDFPQSFNIAYNALCNGDHGAKVQIAPPPGGRIQPVFFRDDFNSFNTDNWEYEVSMYGGLNWEFQIYTNDPKNVYTKNGNLYLQPTLTVDDPRFDKKFLNHGTMNVSKVFGTCTNDADYGCIRTAANGYIIPPVMSGKVKSKPTLRYGIVEVRARIPQGDWLWPTAWLFPKYDKYGSWPRSGEIDIMETRGNNCSIGVKCMTSTLHWGPSPAENKYPMTHAERMASNWADDFHVYRLEWTPDHMTTFVDGEQLLRVDADFWNKGGFKGKNIWATGDKMAPFDQDFFLILNVAVGGLNGFFPDGDFYDGATKPWRNDNPKGMNDFWNARDQWFKTWKGDKAALVVDYVEMRHL